MFGIINYNEILLIKSGVLTVHSLCLKRIRLDAFLYKWVKCGAFDSGEESVAQRLYDDLTFLYLG